MALTRLNKYLVKKDEIIDAISRYADTVEIISEIDNIILFRIQGEGIPDEDIYVNLIYQKFYGIRSMILGYIIFESWQSWMRL